MINFHHKGAVITLVLVFSFIFLILLGSLFGFILLQLRQAAYRIAWNEALHVAEAGAQYYRWCLNNEVAGCEAEKTYYDTEGNLVGSFSIEAIPRISCGETLEQEITATGWTINFPDTKRKVGMVYSRESVASFAYLLNDNVWAGSDREILGPYHSNGGVRMDGENQSVVSSAQEEWVCTSSFGCSTSSCANYGCRVEGSQCICPGVFTSTANGSPDLFDYPVPLFDFTGITIDLAHIKAMAQASGHYLPPVTVIDPAGDGYHIVFQNDGTIQVRIITLLLPTTAYSLEEGWHQHSVIIGSEYVYDTYTINPACSALFAEDDLWLEGEVKGKVMIASADLIDPNEDTSVILVGDINYTAFDGSDGLGVVAEKDILISSESPQQMELRGIFIAQKGWFGRNHYPDNFRDRLEINGSIVSNGRVGTKWSSGGHMVSGYSERENYIDTRLIYYPPSFVPYVNYEYALLNWEEIE